MNQKELNELRRRFKLERSGISHVYGCYVNSNKEIISWVDASLGLMEQEEQEMYLALLKKALSGTLGKNLIDITFSTLQVADSDEHRLLQKLRLTELQDQEAREELCRRIIDNMSMGETNYLILLGADAYDVPYKSGDDEEQADASDVVFKYFVCAICPVKAPTLELKYSTDENQFHSCSSGHIASSPELGFMFPAFDDRSANIYNALFYSKSSSLIHEELISGLFKVEPPMSAAQQKDVFDSTLTSTLEQDCSYDVIQSVHEQIRGRIDEHKESKDPQPLALSVREVGNILTNSGVSEERVKAFEEECEKQYGDDAELNPSNIIESKKYEVNTPEVKISVALENSYLIETKVINGKKYILIPADDGVEINGIGVNIAE